jgi:thiol-disulfide isomerase/thioredoxin
LICSITSAGEVENLPPHIVLAIWPPDFLENAMPAGARTYHTALWGAVALAGAALVAYGLYLNATGGSKVAAPTTPAPAAVVDGAVRQDMATGAIAAFIVNGARPEAAQFAFKDAGGKDRTLADWKGKVVLVNLWATWCAPCRKEMPQLAELQKRFGGDGGPGFEVVAVSVDRKGLAASSEFLKSVGADALALYLDQPGISLGATRSPGLPTTILIDRQGREIGRLLGPADWIAPEAVKLIETALSEK